MLFEFDVPMGGTVPWLSIHLCIRVDWDRVWCRGQGPWLKEGGGCLRGRSGDLVQVIRSLGCLYIERVFETIT